MDHQDQPAPSPIRQAIRSAMAAALPRGLFMTRGPEASRSIAVTFDDGPDPVHTPAILDQLARLGMKATFFVVGARAEAHPGLVARIAAEGHEVGHHSWTHGSPRETSALTAVAEARRTAALLARLLGRGPRLYRPPHGKLTPGKLAGLWALRQTVVLWNRDPRDYSAGSPDPIRRFFESEALAGGDIVLLHDTSSVSAPALSALAARAAALGLGFTTPAEWLDER